MLIRNSLAVFFIAVTTTAIQAQSAMDMRQAAERSAHAVVTIAVNPAGDDVELRRWLDATGLPKPTVTQNQWRQAIVAWPEQTPPRAAFAVASNLVIGWNVEADEPKIQIGNQQLTGKILVRDHVTGLVAIRIDEDDLTPLEFSSHRPQAGMPILVTWWDDATVVHQSGIVASNRTSRHSELGFTYLVDLDREPAMLGAPVVDRDGALLGVLVHKEDRLLMLSSDAVERLIVAASADEPKNLYRGRIGIRLNENTGAAVAQADPESAGAKAGLQAGDVISKINGQQVRTHEDVIAMVATARGGDEITVELKREGETIQKTIELGIVEPTPRYAALATVDDVALQHPYYRIEAGKLVPLLTPDSDTNLDPEQYVDPATKPAIKYLWRAPHTNVVPMITGELQVERSKLEESIRQLEKEKAEQQEMIQKLRDRIAELEARAKELSEQTSKQDLERLKKIVEEMNKKLEAQ